MSNLAKKSISKYLDLQKHELQIAEGRGQTEANSTSLDRNNTEPEGYMQEAISQAKSAWSSYETAHAEHENELSKKISAEEYQVKSGIPDEIKNLEEKKRAEDELFETKEGRNSSEYKKIDEDLTNAKSDYERIRAELNRPLMTRFERVYVPFLFILALAEVPINRKAFELFFSESDVVVRILALAVGIMLVFFAHSLGHLIKENTGSENSGKMTAYSISGLGAIIGVTAILMYMLAVMRQSLANVQGDSTFGDLFEDGGGVEVFQTSIFQPLNTEGISLLVLNFSIYFAGVLASYFRHDHNSSYEKITKVYNKLRDKMAAKKEKIEAKFNSVQSEHNRKLDAINNRRKNLMDNIASMKEELKSSREQKENDSKTVVANVENLLKAYEKGFRSESSNGQAPKYFAKSYAAKIKAELYD